jgi:hypothetical protein
MTFNLSEILGKHHHEIEGLVEEWSKKQDFGRRQVGLDTLKLLKERKKPFYYTSNSFDYPGEFIHLFSI